MIDVYVAPTHPLPVGQITEDRMTSELEGLGILREPLDGGGQSGCVSRKLGGRSAADQLVHFGARWHSLWPAYGRVKCNPSHERPIEKRDVLACRLLAHGETEGI